jgi:hypothetical protein
VDEIGAIKAALELKARPSLAAHFARHPLPPGLESVLRAAAGEAEALKSLMALTGLKDEECTNIARAYCRKVVFSAQASDHRLLGVDRAASADEISRHRRLLAKWLHPDINNNAEDQAIFRRVNAAAQRLMSADEKPEPLPAKANPSAAKPVTSKERRSSRHRRTMQTSRRQRVLLPSMPRLVKRLKQLAMLLAVATLVWLAATPVKSFMLAQLTSR